MLILFLSNRHENEMRLIAMLILFLSNRHEGGHSRFIEHVDYDRMTSLINLGHSL